MELDLELEAALLTTTLAEHLQMITLAREVRHEDV